MSLLSIIAKRARRSGVITTTTPPYTGPALASVDGIVWDENPVPKSYGGFPYGDTASDGALLGMLKASNTHASSGPLVFCKSYTGGASWTYQNIAVGGVELSVSALVAKVLPSGRILVPYQDNPGDDPNTYQDMKTVYSDDGGTTWLQGGSFSWNTGATYINSIYGRPLVLPSGKILVNYYQWPNPYYPDPFAPTTGNLPAISGCLESTDGGLTWTQGAIVWESSASGAFPEGKITEIGWVILPGGTTDANTQIVGLLRNESYGYYHHVRSPNGGATWESIPGDTVYGGSLGSTPYSNNMMYEFGTEFLKTPVDIVIYKGLVSIMNGERDNVGGQFAGVLSRITISPTDFWNNNKLGYSAKQVVVAGANSELTASGYDYGYPTQHIDAHGDLIAHYYDASPDHVPNATGKRCMIYQKVVERATP